MILIVPVMAFAAAVLTVQIAIDSNWPLPYQLMGYPVVSPTLWKIGSLAPLWAFIQNQQNLYLTLTFMAVFIAIFGTIIAMLYAFAYQFIGPPRYGPLDEPPPNIKVKRYKR
jgi:ABC-type phosphate/phosphonate transport system permease subunit